MGATVHTCALDPGLRRSAQQLEAMLLSHPHRSRRAALQLQTLFPRRATEAKMKVTSLLTSLRRPDTCRSV